MGNRCNYVRRRNGELELYYSHWGALTVPADFFWGLAAAQRFLAETERFDEWLDDVFGEGGAALDLDERRLTISGGEIYGAARDLLVEIMSVIWARDGFTVRYVDSIVEVATAVGVPAEDVEAAHLPVAPIDVTDPKQNGRDGMLTALLVLDGTPRLCRDALAVLELGEARVAELATLPDLSEARAIHEQMPLASYELESGRAPMGGSIFGFIEIDTATRTVHALESALRSSKSRRHYAEKWPGWRLAIIEDFETFRRRIPIPGLEPGVATEQRFEELLAKVESHVFGERRDPSRWLDAIMNAHPGGVANPHPLVSPASGRPADDAAADAMFRAAVLEVLAKRK